MEFHSCLNRQCLSGIRSGVRTFLFASVISCERPLAESWEYGIEQLGEHADGAAKMLRKIATDFDGLEKELEATLLPKGS